MQKSESVFIIHEKPETLSLRDLLVPIFRRMRLLIGTFVALLVLALLVGFALFHKYESHMEVLVNRQRLDPVVTTDRPTQVTGPVTPVTDSEVNSEAELLQSRDVLEQVVLANHLQVEKNPSWLSRMLPQASEQDRVARATKALSKKIKIATVDKTNVIDIKYKSSDPDTAYNVLRSLGAFYLQRYAQIHRPSGSYEFFRDEADKYKNALMQSEANLRTLGHDKSVAGPDDERADMAQQVTNSIGDLHKSEEAIAADRRRIQSDQQQLSSTPERTSGLESSNSADLLLQQLGAALLTAQTRRAQLAMKYDSTYPLVKEADEEVAQAKSAIEQAENTHYVNRSTERDPTHELVRQDLAKTTADLAGQEATRSALQSSIKSMQTKMVELDGQALDQADLRREMKSNEDNYLLYASKREQERATDTLNATGIDNVSIALPPSIPVLPIFSPGMIVLGALLLALLVSLGVVYGADYFDSTFHNSGQIADILDIPVVVNIAKRKTA